MPNMNKPAYNKPMPGKPVPKPMPPMRPGKPERKPAMENMPVPRNDMKGNGFTPYAAGKKYYGTGRSAPNMGATGNMAGYAMRDGKAAARREALMRRMGKAT
jgi:hypothetical protein